MPALDIFTETTQLAMLQELRLQNSLISILANGNTIEDWASVAAIARSGNAHRIFAVGDQLISPWTSGATVFQVPWDIKHFGTAVDANGGVHPAIFLQWHFAIPFAIPFDAPEREVATEATFTEGLYYYTGTGDNTRLETVTYGDPIPAGTTYYHNAICDPTCSILKNGYNRWGHSAIRQWLNSAGDAGAWWTAQHVGDVATSAAASRAGFMHGLSSDFLSVVRPVTITTALNTVTDSSLGATEDTSDRFFLPGIAQMYYSTPIEGEGGYWQYWRDATQLSEPGNGANSGRITYRVDAQTTAGICLTRTPDRATSATVYSAFSQGYLTTYHAQASVGLLCSPACVIY